VLNAEVIEGLVGSCLLKRFDGQAKIPQCHRDWWKLVTGPEKFVAIAAPRGHAKSTAISLSYVLASVLFREKKFVLLVSDTETQANLFLGSIKQELQDNSDIISLFGIKKNEKGIVQFKKDSESDVIVEFDDGHSFRIIAKGAEQKLRGLIWNGSRPDLIICDDIENDEAVMNKDRREKFRRWFMGALLPCRSKDGEVRIVGTILHMDSMLERLMPKDSDKQTIVEGLKMYSTKRQMWRSVKYKAHNHDFSLVLWPERHPEESLKLIRQEYIEQGLPDVYSQEYLNVPIDEAKTYFKRGDFIPMSEKDYEKKKMFYVSGDLAISEKERSDWSVLITGGMDEDGILHIIDVIRDRMDGLEICDTILAVQRLRDPEMFGIEDTQITKAIGPFLNRAMIEQNTYPTVIGLSPHKTDKQTRARSIQARMRAGAVRFDKKADWYQTLEDELMRFPRDRHDDQVDAMAYLGLIVDRMIDAPTKEELAEEAYQEEYEESGLNTEGRSEITGY
jgi:predicted phage terminase large subunit-like protein